MSYHNLLHMYGSEQESAEQRVYIYAQAPRKLTTTDQVAYRDKSTAETIRRLESLLEDLRDYRTALAARYNELVTMPYKLRLTLERCPHWKGHIEYLVTITKTLEDGTETEELREVYPGKERRTAFARYESLKRQRPGIEAVKDIARRSWE